MLIKALCDYYDILSKKGKVLPDGYSKVEVHYLIALTEEGKIDEIVDWRKEESPSSGKKMKEKKEPRGVLMPERSEKTGIDANIIEHRPRYIFGLDLDREELFPYEPKDNRKNPHEDFVEKNLKFLEDIPADRTSKVVEAYKRFLRSWEPEKETQNEWLRGLGKNYNKSKFAFCLSGNPNCLLHEDTVLNEKWKSKYLDKTNDKTEKKQCAITGEEAIIARTHKKIKGLGKGGATSDKTLICFNNASESSYGNEQSYNSNISEAAMRKYTEALNYLVSSHRNTFTLDDTTIVFWAMSSQETQEDLLTRLLLESQDQMGADRTNEMLKKLLEDTADGRITEKRLQSLGMIDPEVDFYMLGIKPNSSRLSLQFIIKRKYADILWNIARFQRDLQVSKNFRAVTFKEIKKEMVSPKSERSKVHPELVSRLIEAIIYGREYPLFLLETIVRRVKIDGGSEKINSVRAGVIKACINRKQGKEELKVSLDKTNRSQAYLCGRLFAVLEKLQKEAFNNSLNRTIKDAYFASASAKPALVFPILIRLAQSHLKKVKDPDSYNRVLGEIMDGLNGEFPETFRLMDQGRFIVGYYQQAQAS